MNANKLRRALAVTNGTLTLSKRIDASFGAFLTTYCKNQPIVITDAELDEDDEQVFTVTGKSSFLNQADLPITAHLWVDDTGELDVWLEYELIGEIRDANPWTLSRSLPELPTVWNYATGFPLMPVNSADLAPPLPAQEPYVDSLNLYETRFIVATHGGEDPSTKVAIEAGINLVSRMKPMGALGVLSHLLRGDAEAPILSGRVRIPKPTEVTRKLDLFEPLWDRDDAPGVHLEAPLDLDFSFGELALEDTRLRIYSPHSSAWQAKNTSFSPSHGYAATLRIPSADIEVELGADLEWGLPRATLYARPEGPSLGKLTELADLVGGGGLSAAMPKGLKKAANALEQLELTYLSLFVTMGLGKPELSAVSIEVGMPGLEWKVWKDDIVVYDIACRFEISDPFKSKQRKVAVTLRGTVEIEGVAVEVAARSDGGFTLYAALADGSTLPLGKLMQRYTPDVPVPAKLTVETLRLILSPGKSYSMSTMVSGGSKPWTIPVGKSNLTIGPLLFDFGYAGGKVSGTFAGSATYGNNLQLDVVYTIPGDIVIRSVIDDVKLSQLIKWVAGTQAALPSGFDLDFETSSILIKKVGKDYVFQVGTTIEDIGSFAFEVRKTSRSGWGFAAGFALTGPLSQLPGLEALTGFEQTFPMQQLVVTASSFDAAEF